MPGIHLAAFTFETVKSKGRKKPAITCPRVVRGDQFTPHSDYYPNGQRWDIRQLSIRLDLRLLWMMVNLFLKAQQCGGILTKCNI